MLKPYLQPENKGYDISYNLLKLSVIENHLLKLHNLWWFYLFCAFSFLIILFHIPFLFVNNEENTAQWYFNLNKLLVSSQVTDRFLLSLNLIIYSHLLIRYIIYNDIKILRRINVIYFCPINGEWLEYFSDSNLRHNGIL